ncbi:MAG: S-adenosyl-methyltransferase [Flavobacteriaceae bacterium]|nr:S-adenosyl-methyltransferase [Flavobacteriaceae bacterium]
MPRVKRNIYDILRGSFLTDASSFKNWRIIFFVVVLLLFMISSAHRVDSKVIEIAALNKKKRELEAEYVDTGTFLMRMKMESNIREKVEKRGVLPSNSSPQKIKIITKK